MASKEKFVEPMKKSYSVKIIQRDEGIRREKMARIGKWKQVKIGYASPGGTPIFACGACGGSEHLHGAEYPKKKVLCDNCGRINIYPWERAHEQGSSLWEDDNDFDNKT